MLVSSIILLEGGDMWASGGTDRTELGLPVPWRWPKWIWVPSASPST